MPRQTPSAVSTQDQVVQPKIAPATPRPPVAAALADPARQSPGSRPSAELHPQSLRSQQSSESSAKACPAYALHRVAPAALGQASARWQLRIEISPDTRIHAGWD